MIKNALFTSIGALAVTAIPLATTISCGTNFGKQYRYYGDIQTITDAGSVQDKSFNESSFLATRDFAELQSKTNDEITFGFSQPSASTKILMQKAYLSALKENSEYIVLPGFTHTGTGDAHNYAIKQHGDYPKARYINPDGFAGGVAHYFVDKWSAQGQSYEPQFKAVITKSPTFDTKGRKQGDTGYDPNDPALLDSTMVNPNDPTKPSITDKGYGSVDALVKGIKQKNATDPNKTVTPFWSFGADEVAANVLGGYYTLGYNSYESGFLSAIYGGGFFNETKKVEKPIKAATFGGVAIPFGVTSFMDGYLQGIYWFNQKAGYIWDSTTSAWKPGTVKKRKSDSQNYQPITPIFLGGNKASKEDFTGSFDPGGATSKVLEFVQKNAQMILPVAGPQTGDVVGVVKTKALQGSTYVFGVDTDQSLVYDPNIILGSAVKGVYASTSFALDALKANPDSGSFSPFGLKLKSDKGSSFYKYIYGPNGTPENPEVGSLLKKLLDDANGNKVAIRNAKIRVLPTGFAPSFSADKNPLNLEDIIAEILLGTNRKWSDIENIAGGSIAAEAPQASPGTTGLSHDTAEAYGSYLGVAFGG